MTLIQAQLIDIFWSLIRRRERDIRENGDRPYPWDNDDHWDFEIEEAYEAIYPILVCISKPQIFVAVSSLTHLRGSFAAENALQALMLQLQLAEALYGNPSQLDSEKYLDIRNKADAESAQLAAMDKIPVAVPLLPRVGSEIWNDDYEVRWEMPSRPTNVPDHAVEINGTREPLEYRLTPTQLALVNAANDVPQLTKELADKAGCKDQTARKYLPKLEDAGLVLQVRQGYVRP